MSEEMEKQPVPATNAPFRRRRPSRRRAGRRNDSERPPGSVNDSGGDGDRPGGPDILDEDRSGQREDGGPFVETADRSGENRMPEEQRERRQGGSPNGEQPPREPEV